MLVLPGGIEVMRYKRAETRGRRVMQALGRLRGGKTAR